MTADELPEHDARRLALLGATIIGTPREVAAYGHLLQALELECARLDVPFTEIFDAAMLASAVTGGWP